MINQSDETLELILRRHGLAQCQNCQTPITAANVGWNPAPDFKDVFPIVFVACKVCQKRLKVFQWVFCSIRPGVPKQSGRLFRGFRPGSERSDAGVFLLA